MDILEAKETVIKAGKRLVETGLIARTWGNVSCRVDGESFVITPSGRDYLNLTADDIVLVKIEDCSYEGDVKPSSEKGIHAAAYSLRPNVNFVIHTHQLNASAVSFIGNDINFVPEESREIIGNDIPVAAYGLPGTGKLRKGVIGALTRSQSKAAIMAHHGAVCLGVDYDDAFNVASELEKVCEKYLKKVFSDFADKTVDTFSAMAEHIADVYKEGESCKEIDPYTSERDGTVMNMYSAQGDLTRINLENGEVLGEDKNYPDTMELHRRVYNKRKDVNCIVHSKQDEIVAVSKYAKAVKPLLDDFAQLIGVTLKGEVYDPTDTLKSAKKVVKKLRSRNAVLLKDNGAVCVAGDKDDALAVEMVLSKGARAELASKMFGGAKVINPIEATLMRVIYKKKYSKQKEN